MEGEGRVDKECGDGGSENGEKKHTIARSLKWGKKNGLIASSDR